MILGDFENFLFSVLCKPTKKSIQVLKYYPCSGLTNRSSKGVERNKSKKFYLGVTSKKRVYLKTLSIQVGVWSRPFQNYFNKLIFDIRWGQISF